MSIIHCNRRDGDVYLFIALLIVALGLVMVTLLAVRAGREDVCVTVTLYRTQDRYLLSRFFRFQAQQTHHFTPLQINVNQEVLPVFCSYQVTAYSQQRQIQKR